MKGKIVKGVGGFYYVHLHLCKDSIYECKAKGIFRNQKIKPKIGDDVEIDIIDEDKKLGNIVSIYDRKNDLIRPAVANVDQAMIIFAYKHPEPNLNLLDRFLIMLENQGLSAIVCINKVDLYDETDSSSKDDTAESKDDIAASKDDVTALKDGELTPEKLKKIYESCGHRVILASTKKNIGIDEIAKLIAGKTTVFAGPSGVGKSSMLNMISPDAEAETGDLSEKIKRGKHTTRHSELMYVGEDTFIMDTPGFSSLDVFVESEDELRFYYSEFDEYFPDCRFNGCYHMNEPGCAVKAAVAEGNISKIRYENYKQLYAELKDKRKW